MASTPKIISSIILFGIAALCGILACVSVKWLVLKFGQSSKFKRIIGILNCFSGGVFFATSIMNLLPEARESMELSLEKYELDSEYPFTELALSVGFFLILTLEHVAYSCCGTKANTYTAVPGGIKQSVDGSGNTHVNNKSYKPILQHEDSVLVKDFEDSSGLDDVTYQNYGMVDESLDKTSVYPYVPEKRNDTPNTVVVFAESDQIVFKNTKSAIQKPVPFAKDVLYKIKDESTQHIKQSKLRGLVLLVALSLHMVFDGLALGLLKSDDKVWSLLAALALHKALVFITIGMQTYEMLATVKKSIIVILVLSLVSPLGILIGESINSGDDSLTRDMTSAVLQGIATGTFLFVTFFEILQHELGSNDHDVLKVVMAILGFALVAALRIMEHEDH